MRTFLRAAGLMVAAAALILLGPAALAHADTGKDADAGKDAVTAQDAAFLRAAHQSNLAEIETGTLAEKRGKDGDVRALGALFVKHHSMLDADLKKVAKKAGVDLPDRPNAAQRATAATLRGLSGADFDKAWLDAQVLSHRKAAADGRTEQTKGSNDDVVTVAKKSAPVIEDHLRRLLDAKDDAKKDDASTATHDSGTSSDQEKGGDDHPAAKSGDCPDAKHAA